MQAESTESWIPKRLKTDMAAQDALSAAIAVSGTSYCFDTTFHYLIPPALADAVKPGVRVIIPFGRGNRKRVGFVLRIEPPDGQFRLKPILAVADDEPVMNEELLSLVSWLHETTFCTYYDGVKTILPSGMNLRIHETYRLCDADPQLPLSDEEENLLGFIRLAKSQRELDAMLDTRLNPEKADVIASLLAKGCIEEVQESHRMVGDKTLQMLRLSDAYLMDEVRHQPSRKQSQVIAFLEEVGTSSQRETCYLCGVTPAVIKTLIKHRVIELFEQEQLRTPAGGEFYTRSVDDVVLSEQQQAVYSAVADQVDLGEPKVFLLHGVTGSGKTSVFEKLIAHTLETGRQALLLIPEISLTPQMVSRFQSLFGETVAVIHSSLSLGQRMDEYKRIEWGEANIVIGTRSAVFAPLTNIGLIIMDEEGERSYKSDSAPRYHAADVAKQRCKTHGAVLLLASATPSLESYYYARRGVYTLLEMPERYGNAVLPAVELVDMNEERAWGNQTEFSRALVDAIGDALEAGEQSILLLNRRGYHTIISCASCNAPLECPNCSIPLTYHRPNDSLMCHYCGYVSETVTACPSCKSEHLKQMGFGTQKLEEQIAEYFPTARILRMDADTTFSRYAYEQKFKAFGRGEYDIMLGTQMIGKGLDFPNVTVVGVLSIDKALFAGDFRSYERTFSLVTQVVGRGGRGNKPGRAILQSFLPEHYILQLAAEQDYCAFYNEEIALRKSLMFPPVCDICVLGFSSELEQNVRAAADTFLRMMRDKIRQEQITLPMRVLGPVRCAYGRIAGKYRYRLLIKCKNTPQLRAFISELLHESGKFKEFARVQLFADMNGDLGV